jgi:hypothetical protein
VKNLAGTTKVDQPLIGNIACQKVVSKMPGKNPALIAYLNMESLSKGLPQNAMPVDLKGMVEMLGLNSVKAVSEAMAIKGGNYYPRKEPAKIPSQPRK